MVKYCIGVDVLNFPIYVIHYIDACSEISVPSQTTAKSFRKRIKKSNKHFSMKHK